MQRVLTHERDRVQKFEGVALKRISKRKDLKRRNSLDVIGSARIQLSRLSAATADAGVSVCVSVCRDVECGQRCVCRLVPATSVSADYSAVLCSTVSVCVCWSVRVGVGLPDGGRLCAMLCARV